MIRYSLIIVALLPYGCGTSVPPATTAGGTHSLASDRASVDISLTSAQSSDEVKIAAAVTENPFAVAEREADAEKLCLDGIASYKAKRMEEALASWQRVLAEFEDTPAWAKSALNSGMLLQELERHKEAISKYEFLLNVDINNKAPTGYIDEPYANYQHWACLKTAQCYEATGSMDNALHFAVLARDKYPYETWCGTCAAQHEEGLAKYVAQLKSGADMQDRGSSP